MNPASASPGSHQHPLVHQPRDIREEYRNSTKHEAFADDQAPPRRALQPTQRRDAYWHGKDCCGWEELPRASWKAAAVHPQCVTDVVQTDGVNQLPKEHTHYVTPRTEGARHGIHAGLARKFRNQMRWNQIAKLAQNSELGCGWFGVSFYHLCRVTKLKSHANHFFLCFNRNSYGMAVFCVHCHQLMKGKVARSAAEG